MHTFCKKKKKKKNESCLLVSYVFIDFLKLDWFDFYSLNRPRASKYAIKADRIRMKAAYDTKKLVKEAEKVRRRQQYVQRKEGKLPLQF